MIKNMRIRYIIAISVAVVTFIVYLPSLKNEFVWDDAQYVYSNSFIRSLDTQLVTSAFVEFHEANWHPLTWLSHAFDYVIWGLNPLGHHLTNNIFHALNTFMVVFLVMRLMEDYNKTAGNNALLRPFLDDRTIRITSAATGLLFGLHPLHVESVAWVAERKDLLCAFFFLLTLMTYSHYVSEINARASVNSASRYFNKKYLFTIGLFTLSLLSKPMAVTLPVVLLILDWYLFRRIQSLKTFWTAFNEKLPFIALSLSSSILTILAQEAGGAIASVDTVPLKSRVMVAAESLTAYLEKMLLPLNLVPYYPYPERISLFSSEYIIPIVIVIAITVTCIIVVRKQQLWISVWSYYVITLTPVLGIVQVGSQSMADRYTYLPSLGPFLILGLIAAKVYDKVAVSKRWESIAKMAALFGALVMLVFIAYATIKQINIWKNEIILWNYIIDKGVSGMPVAHYNLGLAFASKGEFDRAIEQYQAALRLRWDFIDAYYDLGLAFASKGEFDRAIEQYQAALRLKPQFVEAYNNLGLAFASKGKFDRAIEQYQTALSLQPNLAEAHFNLGWSYLKKGSKEMARREFEVGLTIKPDVYSARQTLNSIGSK